MEQILKKIQKTNENAVMEEAQKITNSMNEKGFELTMLIPVAMDKITWDFQVILVFTKK